MPRIIDHNQRRLDIAAIVVELVYERGVEALTIRDVAERAGYSTTIVSHYFRSKLEMLLFTHKTVRLNAEKMIAEAIAARASFAETLLSILPVNEYRYKDWNTWFAFWGMTPANPLVTEEWTHTTFQANQLFVDLVKMAQEKGEIPAHLDPAFGANMARIIINGIATLWVQERSYYAPDKVEALLQQMLSQAGLTKTAQ